MKELTEAQKKVLDFIFIFFETNNFSPSTEDIRQNFGWASKNSVTSHLIGLEKKGYIQFNQGSNKTRKIKLIKGICPVCGHKLEG